jgi:uncharacterized protein YkwD
MIRSSAALLILILWFVICVPLGRAYELPLAQSLKQAQKLLQEQNYDEAEKRFIAIANQLHETVGGHDTRSWMNAEEVRILRCHLFSGLIDCYAGRKEFDKAALVQERMLEFIQANGGSDVDRAREYNNAALLMFKSGNLQRARQYLETALSMSDEFYEPEYTQLHVNYRKVLLQLEDREALAKFEAKAAIMADRSEAPDDAEKRSGKSENGRGTTSDGAIKNGPQPKSATKVVGDALDLSQARQYLLGLINRDRAACGRGPVALDETACKAAQFHTDDLAARGYNDHYDPEGRSPDWRYTLLRGTNMIAENNLGPYCDPKWKYELAPAQFFTKNQLEKVQSGFFNERPPQDGHRKNILRPQHNRVGIGLSVCNVMDTDGSYGFRYVTCCQEFMDAYGKFSALPLSARHGETLSLQGKLDKGVQLYCVEVMREEFPKPVPMPQLRLNAYGGYKQPENRVNVFWMRDVKQQPDGSFLLEIPVEASWPKGLYHFCVWVKDGNHDAFVTSRQIVAVEPAQPILPLDSAQP